MTDKLEYISTQDELRNLSVVVPSYNARDLLRQSLKTLLEVAPNADIIVIDGESHDGSADMVRREFPKVRLRVRPNHGFAHAINRGLELTRREYVLLLNSDLFVTREALSSCIARLRDDRSVAAVSPVLCNQDGSYQHVFGWPGGWFYWPNVVPVRRASRVPVITAACFMTRRDVLLNIGGLDENFFLYNEEHDWCARAHAAGYHIEIVPERVVHVGGGSTARNPSHLLEARRGFLYCLQKHGSRTQLEFFRRAMQFQGVCQMYADPRREHRKMWKALHALTARGSYLESPFALSGRGDSTAQPQWPVMMSEQEREMAAHFRQREITGTRKVIEAEKPAYEQLQDDHRPVATSLASVASVG